MSALIKIADWGSWPQYFFIIILSQNMLCKYLKFQYKIWAFRDSNLNPKGLNIDLELELLPFDEGQRFESNPKQTSNQS